MSDIFSDTPPQTQTVRLAVNGSDKGDVQFSAGTTIATFVTTQARVNGIRTFSVYLDGTKLDTNDASGQLEPGSSIEIVAKDSRG